MKQLLLFTVIMFCVAAMPTFAALPFEDLFDSSGPKTDWGTGTYNGGLFGLNGTLSVVSSDTDWRGTTINPPDGNTDGYFGKLSFAATGYATAWRTTGEDTDTEYTLEAKIYTPLVNTPDEPDDYLYQMLVFYETAAGYGRLHTQFNLDTTVLPAGPRIRFQTTHGGFQTPLVVSSPATFTATEGWHTFRVEISAAKTANCYFDTTFLGTADFSGVAGADGGKYGFGTYIDGDTAGNARSIYIDDFKAFSTTPVEDWTLYE